MIFRTRRAVLYQEPNILESVAQYHHLFRLPIPASPALPDSVRCQLQVSLLKQEIQGLKTAIVTKNSLIQAANALANLQYAIGRAVLEFGRYFHVLHSLYKRKNFSLMIHKFSPFALF